MNFLGIVNEFRRRAMSVITRNIGISEEVKIDITKATVNRVLICRPNHRLGNQLLMTPLLQEMMNTFPNAKIDLLVKGKAGPIIFKNYECVEKIIQLPSRPFSHLLQYLKGWITIRRKKYDLVFNAVNHSSSGRLATKFANATYKCFGDLNDDVKSLYSDHEHNAKHPVYSFRNFIGLSLKEVGTPIPTLNLRLNSQEIEAGKKIMNNLIKNDKKTISIFTYATRDKCYSESWWSVFYERLMEEFPLFNIVEVLPVENVSQISFKAPSFYSKDIREIGSFIANTEMFIGADSGMMHLAVASQTPTVGLFKVTSASIFGPYGNHSVAIDTNNSEIGDWIKIISRVIVHAN